MGGHDAGGHDVGGHDAGGLGLGGHCISIMYYCEYD